MIAMAMWLERFALVVNLIQIQTVEGATKWNQNGEPRMGLVQVRTEEVEQG